ncbi:hypothetical protein PSN45_001412 [Yamadazyma tenuis]|uniref:Large ribosomal subunit protein mL60 n=1 Tax=Candida tenuis (strain ATCC 10573 / BCRC 21748 / CBS 615 / JCM 9827 / NBRC 10315 / NRRL Y-1498 / VKM Y-70) TaxID=590646 RepID=G3BCC0_CANTC|nr:uncharacterized protein CANTEDRAFT_96236 [Yamadazyma tenuis ATCC 10573]EGV60798.1 hypothetical protein CANTEDRAFT_96236 [Yamadazyma tenuis ATCC 10573]WEJ93935.1 hypothetical protein PSN45_001412 [Yamadazyma tenuis]
MFGAFRASLTNHGGYLWKSAPRLSSPQKSRLRQRMKTVDANIEAIYQSLPKDHNGLTSYRKVDYLKFKFPKENEMSAKDKYTTFDKKAKDYRKLVFKVPKWTKKSFRENPMHH